MGGEDQKVKYSKNEKIKYTKITTTLKKSKLNYHHYPNHIYRLSC